MGQLILMRHAKSDWTGETSDHDRPLNDRGRKSAKALGQWLQARGYQPDHALVSSAVRTRETWALLGLPLEPTLSSALYHASPGEIMAVLSQAVGETVLVVGHNPGIGDLAQILPRALPDHPRLADYPTGATMVIEFDSPWNATKPGTGRALEFVIPQDLI